MVGRSHVEVIEIDPDRLDDRRLDEPTAHLRSKEASLTARLTAAPNETPNIVYDLLLGGVLSATLVPLFASYMGTDDEEPDDHATNVVITVATTLMVVITVVAVALAPLIFRLYSLNVTDDVDADLFRVRSARR